MSKQLFIYEKAQTHMIAFKWMAHTLVWAGFLGILGCGGAENPTTVEPDSSSSQALSSDSSSSSGVLSSSSRVNGSSSQPITSSSTPDNPGVSSSSSDTPPSSGGASSNASSSSQIAPPVSSSSEDWVVLNLVGDSGVYTDARDNNEYKWVRVGSQIWMAENLRYNGNGTLGEDHGIYAGTGREAPDYDFTGEGDVNGYYYSWATALTLPLEYNRVTYDDERYFEDDFKVVGICPAGWHIPSYSEGYNLGDYIATTTGKTDTDDEGFLEIAVYMRTTKGWNLGGSGNDRFGLSMIPSGKYSVYDSGNNSWVNGSIEFSFRVTKQDGRIFAYRWMMDLHSGSNNAYHENYTGKYHGMPIRCVANQ